MQERNDSFEELRANLLEKREIKGVHRLPLLVIGTNATAFSNG